jgi:cathepsin A (carboxypeptidase C)
MGLFMELGPCTIRDGPKNATDTEINPHSWTNKANMFFLDEPVDVGFSQSKHGQLVDTTEKAAEDVAAFISIVSGVLEHALTYTPVL